jgi:hypothetical protein
MKATERCYSMECCMTSMTKISRDDVEVSLCRAGLSLSPVQIDQIFSAWGLVEPMLARVRHNDAHDPDGPNDVSEQAGIFRADAYMPQSAPKDNP